MKTFFLYLLLILCSTALAQGQLLIDLNPGSSNSNPSLLTVVNDYLYFSATDGQSGAAIFKSDGTAEGTEFMFAAPMITLVSSGPSSMIEFDGLLLFHHFNGQFTEIYLSDGTVEGTAIVTNPALSSATKLTTPISDFGYHYRTGSPEKFYRLEPGTHESVMLTGPDLPDGISAAQAFAFCSCGDRVYFSGSTSSQGVEPYVSHGTHEGTYRIADLNPGSANSWPRHFTCFNDGVMFSARVGTAQRALYRWDGPGSEIEQVILINQNADAFSSWSDVKSMFRLSNGVYLFLANDGEHGTELWRTDGTEQGTYMVKDIRPGPLGSTNSSELGEFFSPVGDGSQAIFSAHDGVHGREWHITDGTQEGTNMVIDLDPGVGVVHTFLQRLALNGKVYFRGRVPTGGYELFVTDGTADGTVQLTNIRDGQGDAGIANITYFNNHLYFRADDGVHGTEVWMLDLGKLSANPVALRDFEFSIYPNPATDLLLFQLPENAQGVYHLRIHDMQGRVVKEYSNFAGGAIDVGMLPAGMYMLRAIDAQGRVGVRKFVKGQG